MKRNVFLVDDHPLVREWLATLINRQPDLAVCGEAESAPQAREKIVALEPEVAIVDITLEKGSGLELIKDLRILCPGTATIVLSMHEESLYAERAFRAGARGYVTKKETTRKILTAIRQVLEGHLYMGERLAEHIAGSILEGKNSGGSAVDTLSDRELEVFRMMGRGMKTRDIAESLHISMKTVQVYCARIKSKLNLADSTQLLREAMRWHEAGAAG